MIRMFRLVTRRWEESPTYLDKPLLSDQEECCEVSRLFLCYLLLCDAYGLQRVCGQGMISESFQKRL